MITGSTVTGNTATAGAEGSGGTPSSGGIASGAGVFLETSSAAIRQTTIAGNLSNGTATGAEGRGAGVDISNTTAIVDSTVAGNAAESSASESSPGGAIFTIRPTTLAGDTIDGNSGSWGSGIFAEAAVTIGSTVIAGAGGGGANCASSGGSFADLAGHGGNLEDDPAASCGFSPTTGDIVGKAAMLGALASNGGTAVTMLPLPGSPLIGAGGACVDPTAGSSAPLTVDERGLPRPAGGPCDIGAVQVQSPSATTAPSIAPATPAVGQTATCNPGIWAGDGTLLYVFAWLRDGSAIAGQTGPTYTVSASDAGHSLSCVVTASSSYGRTSTPAASAGVKVAVPALPGGSGVGGGGGSTVEAPSVLDLRARETHEVWRAHGRAKRHAAPVGTRFSITLNASANVTLTFTRAAAHRKHGSKRAATLGRLVVSGHAGVNIVRFSATSGTGAR